MRILVTGGTGFIGSHIAKKYLDEGHDVTITGTQTENVVYQHHGVNFLECSFHGIDWNQLYGFDVVFHQAALNDTMSTNRSEMFRANVSGPIQLFTHLAKVGCRKFVYASSTAVYGNMPAPYVEGKTPTDPLNHYAESKLVFEEWVNTVFLKSRPDVQAVGLRYCNVYGPGECHKDRRSSMVRQLAMQMIRGENPKLFKHGEQKRDWVYVKDVVAANVAAAAYDGSGIFNCGYGRAVSFNDIVDAINYHLYMRLKPEYIDNPRPESYQTFTECGMKKAADLLGHTPKYDLEDALREYLPCLMDDRA